VTGDGQTNTATQPQSNGPAPARGFAPGKRSTGKMVRDALLVFVILAMGLPFVMANIGEASLTAEQEEWARLGRRAALEQEDWLANSMGNKVSEVETEGEGLRFHYRYYTFFGIPWGRSEAYVGPDGSVSDVITALNVTEIF
jgi:hypothetical protein